MEYFWLLCVTRDQIWGRAADQLEPGTGDTAPLKLSSVSLQEKNWHNRRNDLSADKTTTVYTESLQKSPTMKKNVELFWKFS